MTIYIGADHRGFELKESLKKYLTENNYQVVDLGNDHYDVNDDYPDFAKLVAGKVSQEGENSRGILICRSGAGVDIVANKFKGVRSSLITDINQAELVRKDDDVNILSLASELVDDGKAKKIVDVWLKTPFSGTEKDIRRINKISGIEK